jgi:uncharacterized protein YyaL (SSP411 family)
MLKRITLLLLGIATCHAADPAGIEWRSFDKDLLEQARAQHKLVFVDVEAVWCHWCHVMDAKTYSDTVVQAALAKDFVCTKVDQDARPDISRRYGDYGWPALVILDPVTMKERAIGSGFQPPADFLALLEKARTGKARKSGSQEKASGEFLSDAQRKQLGGQMADGFDADEKGWGNRHKYVNWQNVELCIRHSQGGEPGSDSGAKAVAQDTLEAGRKLIDPVWGGVYQYSTDGDWVHPHFEKIMEFQGEICRVYALAYLAYGRDADLASARQIVKFMRDFLKSDEGAFFTSQDADVVEGEHSADYFVLGDAERRQRGIPRIDRHLYARENGFAITALVWLWQASGDEVDLADATRAAEWVMEHRSLPEGGFAHDEKDAYGPYLGDQAQMLRGLLALHEATGEARWLERAEACADFIDRKLKRPVKEGAGYFAGAAYPDQPAPVADLDENLSLARSFNLLFRVTAEARFKAHAAHAMRYCSSHEALDGLLSNVGGVLLADQELTHEPAHIAIVGKKDDPTAKALFLAAQHQPSSYRVIDWIDPGAPAKQNGIEYPAPEHAAAFLCSGGRCSRPLATPAELLEKFR